MYIKISVRFGTLFFFLKRFLVILIDNSMKKMKINNYNSYAFYLIFSTTHKDIVGFLGLMLLATSKNRIFEISFQQYNYLFFFPSEVKENYLIIQHNK